jgi:hypothetical protein
VDTYLHRTHIFELSMARLVLVHCAKNIHVHHPTNESNPAHVESLVRGKARPDFFKLAQRFGAIIVPPGTQHGMSECFILDLSIKPSCHIGWNQVILLTQLLEFGLAHKYKMALISTFLIAFLDIHTREKNASPLYI